jgi:glycosyltransferase involved in cell wall biosynthesis
MCTRDGERFVGEQLRSILEQDRAPYELVLFDDASTDRTVAVAEETLRDTPFPTQIVRNPMTLGVTANFSAAIASVRGDVVVLADQDDVWHPGKLSRIAAELARSDDVVAVFSDATLIDGDGKPVWGTLWRGVGVWGAARRRFDGGKVLDQLVRWKVVTGATLAFRSRLIPLLLPMPEGTLHDSWIALVAALTGRVVPVARPLMSYRVHPGNTVGLLNRYPLKRFALHRDDDGARAEELTMFRAAARRTTVADARRLELVRRKIRFLEQRAALSSEPLRRVPAVASGLATGRYHRLGHGARSAAHDLVFGP